MADALKNPPILSDDLEYGDWKSDIGIWELYTSLDKKKRGPALYLSLQGKARECIRGRTADQIGGETGVQLIITKLDAVYQEDVNMRTFVCFKTFYEYRRSSGVGMKEFIIHYELLYHKLGTFSVELPEGVQAFFLLTAANISEEYEKLARATCKEMSYKEMKATILKIFADPAAGNSHDESVPSIKCEPVFKVSHRGGYRGGYRGRGSYRSASNSDLNPKYPDGKIMKCFKCNSTKHLARFCTQNSDNESVSEKNAETVPGKKKERVHITLLSNSASERRMSNLVKEALGMAVLDTACSKTVVGETWLNEYEETLSSEERKSVTSFPSDTSFVFGDGAEVIAERSVKIPVTIGSKSVDIRADVVSNEIPLLLSRQSMSRGEVIIDVKRNTANVLGEKIKLVNTSSGHICLPLTNKLLIGDMASSIVLHTSSLKNCSKSQKKRKAMKLHRQLSHASKGKMKTFVKNSEGFNDVEFLKMIEQCCDRCEICRRFKKPQLKPIVCMPLSDKFNGVVCMDLKEHI